MLDKKNRGLSYVRELTLYDSHESERLPRQEYQYPEVALLVHFLPENTLTKFQGVNGLRIMPSQFDGMPKAACAFFQNHREIRHLTLDFWHMEIPEEVVDTLTDGEALLLSRSNALTALFADFKRSEAQLRSLNLNSVDLGGTCPVLPSALDISMLSELSLLKCTDPQVFLVAVNKSPDRSRLRLRKFSLYHARGWEEPPTDPAEDVAPDPLLKEVNDFLKNIPTALTELKICLRGFDQLPDAASITRHGETLKWLFLDVRRQKGRLPTTYSNEQWRMLCSSLTSIHQIDTAYPPVVADGGSLAKYGDFFVYVHAAIFTPTLRVLGVNNWPFPIGTDLSSGTPRIGAIQRRAEERRDPAYHQLLGVLATRLVQRGNNKIATIAFGMSERITKRLNHGYVSPMYYARSQVSVLGGEQKVRMELVADNVLERYNEFEREEWDIDGIAHDIGNFEFGGDDDWE
ncbi:MAG: hypothetical protein Q9170_006582 [Blastenia crenularia]